MKLEPFEHDYWKQEVLMRYPSAFFQDDSTPSSVRERVLNRGKVVGFYMCPHATGQGSGYVIPLEVEG